MDTLSATSGHLLLEGKAEETNDPIRPPRAATFYRGSETMQLYHFCERRAVRGILTDGLTKGVMPLFRKNANGGGAFEFCQNWQWMTTCGDHAVQSWATSVVYKNDRTEFRFTVDIPAFAENGVRDREEMTVYDSDADALFEGWPGSADWRTYHGAISKYWLAALDQWDPETGEWKRLWTRGEPRDLAVRRMG